MRVFQMNDRLNPFLTFNPHLSSSSSSSCSVPAQPTTESQNSAVTWTAQLWEEFFSDPSQWWDTRNYKRNPRFPDFRHKTERKALWISNRTNPPWVQARLAAMVQCQEKGQSTCLGPEISGRSGRMLQIEQLWHKFFQDPSQWWDNRFVKRSPKFPDFRHKSTHDGLWIEGPLNPPWVQAKLTAMESSQLQAGGVFGLWVQSCFRNTDSMIKACEGWQLEDTLDIVEQMIRQNIQAPTSAYLGLLKVCTRRKALKEGLRVHALVIKSGLASDTRLGTAIVDMYAKCGSLLEARKVFDRMPEQNLFAWTVIISAYANHGEGEEALNLYQQMRLRGIMPDKVAFVVIVNACARMADLEQGKQVHFDITKSGFESDVIVGNALVDMYAKCGCMEQAHETFDKMNERDVISWGAIIAGYVQNQLAEQAFDLYGQMTEEAVQPDNVTYVILLKACADTAALERGKKLHADIIRAGLGSDVAVANTLVDMYAKCGCMETAWQVFENMKERDIVSWNSVIAGFVKYGQMNDAQNVFNKMNRRDVVSWNSMIAGYAQHGHGKDALALYKQMNQEGMAADGVTFVALLKACASIPDLEKAKQLHSDIIDLGFESDIFVGSALLDMYSKCGCLDGACEVFNNMKLRDVVSWNAMIAGNVQHGLGQEALALYEQMKQENMQPDNVTYVSLLKACAITANLDQGKQLHLDSLKNGFGSDLDVKNALVNMYVKCGCIEYADELFFEMSERDVVSWNGMIAGYTEKGFAKEAFSLYEKMKHEGVKPDNITFVLLLKTCSSIAALDQGKQLHSHIIESGIESDVLVCGALLSMYAKCGSIEQAHHVFDSIHEPDLVSWNTLIAGYAQQGLGKEAVKLLEHMQEEGMKPNYVTYISVLSACSHCGLVDEGCRLFASMCNDHGITPTMDHYACMVDLLGRAGYLEEAEALIKRMPFQPDATIWITLLGAARTHGHLEIGRHAFDCLVKLEPENSAAYVLLSRIYEEAGSIDKVPKTKENGQMKNFGVT